MLAGLVSSPALAPSSSTPPMLDFTSAVSFPLWYVWWCLPALDSALQSWVWPLSTCWWSWSWLSSVSRTLSSSPPLRNSPLPLRSGVLPPVQGPSVMSDPSQFCQPGGRSTTSPVDLSILGIQERIVPIGASPADNLEMKIISSMIKIIFYINLVVYIVFDDGKWSMTAR